jgi:hypothetical protein
MNNVSISIEGHCLITDDLDRVHLNQCNSIHSSNMSRIIARGLAHEDNCGIFKIAFGNGGTTVKSGVITYEDVNDSEWDAALHNETYYELVNAGTEGDIVSTDRTTSGDGCVSLDKDRLSQVVITCTLNKNEPADQTDSDNISQNFKYFDGPDESRPVKKYSFYTEDDYVFDEIGLFTTGTDNGYENNAWDGTQEQQRMLTHLIFSPVRKTANRIFNIKYTLTVYVNRTPDYTDVTFIEPTVQA